MDGSQSGQRWWGKWRMTVIIKHKKVCLRLVKKPFLQVVWYCCLFTRVILQNAAKSSQKKSGQKDTLQRFIFRA